MPKQANCSRRVRHREVVPLDAHDEQLAVQSAVHETRGMVVVETTPGTSILTNEARWPIQTGKS